MWTTLLVFLTSLLVFSQAKVAYRTNYEDFGESYAMNEEKHSIENDVDSVREEENFVNSFSISHEKTKEKDEKTSFKRMPDKLIRLLKNTKSFSDVKRILDAHIVREDYQEDAVEKREVVSVTASLKCPIKQATSITTLPVTNSTTTIRLYFEPGCQPVPVVVKFIPPSDGYYFPSATTLHRCIGSCFQGHLYQCEVTQQQEIKYKLHKITHDGSYTEVDIKAMNHTGCACDCITKESHCDPKKMRYDADYCSCECIEDGSSCNSDKKKWVPAQCSCECKYPEEKCGSDKEWSTDTCSCEPKS